MVPALPLVLSPLNKALIAIAILAAVSAGVYMQGRSDGKAIAKVDCESRINDLQREHSKLAALFKKSVEEKQANLDQEVEKLNTELERGEAIEQALRRANDAYLDKLAKREDAKCELNQEDIEGLE